MQRKYRRLPIEDQLLAIQQKDGEEAMVKAREALFNELRRSEGFQLIIAILRNLEQVALNTLYTSLGSPDRLLGRLQCIEDIRLALASLLPVGQRDIDWYEEESEPLLDENN